MAHLLPIHHSFEVKTWLFPYCLISCCHPVYMQGTISPAARWRKGCGGRLRVKESDVGRRPAQASAPFSTKGLKHRCVYVLTSLRFSLLSIVPFWVGKGVLQTLPSDTLSLLFPLPCCVGLGTAAPWPAAHGSEHVRRARGTKLQCVAPCRSGRLASGRLHVWERVQALRSRRQEWLPQRCGQRRGLLGSEKGVTLVCDRNAARHFLQHLCSRHC